jgi:putative aminopeptidase FrvX
MRTPSFGLSKRFIARFLPLERRPAERPAQRIPGSHRLSTLFKCLLTTLLLSFTAIAQTGPDQQALGLMQELTDAPSPSGNESAVRAILIREFKALGADVSTDGMGNVIAVVRGAADSPRVMVDAHMDEVGLVVRSITPDGFIRFLPMSINWFDQPLVDQRWQIMTSRGPVMAVSGFLDKHAHTVEDNTRVFPSYELFLDVGAHDKEEAQAMGIAVGDLVAPWSPFARLGPARFAAKAWDDRAGCFVMLEALRRMRERGIKTQNTIYFVGSVQEELGMRGATNAVEGVKPDVGIALEAGVATDYPLGRKEFSQEELGAGPSVYAYDGSMIPNHKLSELVQKLADQNKIPLQISVVAQYGEDASEIQKYSTGRPAINLAVPTRYTHLHTGVVDWNDVNRAADLLVAVLAHLDNGTVADLNRY